jgi:hypothetical protein
MTKVAGRGAKNLSKSNATKKQRKCQLKKIHYVFIEAEEAAVNNALWHKLCQKWDYYE